MSLQATLILTFSKANFTTPFTNARETFLRGILGIPFSLKLDWIWLRGLCATDHGIAEKICISDHWPLWTTLELPSLKETQLRVVERTIAKVRSVL